MCNNHLQLASSRDPAAVASRAAFRQAPPVAPIVRPAYAECLNAFVHASAGASRLLAADGR